MPTTDTTPAQKVTVLKHLLHGRDAAFIITATKLTESQVSAIKRDHGWPDEKKMKWAVDILEKQVDAVPTADRLKDATAVEPRPAPGPRVTSTPAAGGGTPAAADTTARILDAAKASDKARTRRLGEKITEQLEQLRTLVAEEQAERRAAAEKAAQAAANAKRIAELEAELAKLTGKPVRSAKSSPTTATSDSKAIRAWAAKAGVQCPAVGRVPQAVRDQYDAAHAEPAA